MEGTPRLWTYIRSHDQAALVLAIPASILLGLLSNIIVFMGLNEWLVRRPFARDQPGLFSLFTDLTTRIRTKYRDSLDITDTQMEESFDKYVDSEYLLLHQIGVQEFAYVREQYWYHLEFQLNLLLSVTAFAVALAVFINLNVPSLLLSSSLLFVCLVFAGLLVRLLLVAARKNYTRHIAKIVTLMAAVLGATSPQTSTAVRWLKPCVKGRRQCCTLP